jgi:hypothetical protein
MGHPGHNPSHASWSVRVCHKVLALDHSLRQRARSGHALAAIDWSMNEDLLMLRSYPVIAEY